MAVGTGQTSGETGGRRALRLLVPAVLLLLILVQLFRAFRGFDATSGGLLSVFEVPGRLLGWGGVLLLLLLFAWSLLDPRLRGAANATLRLLGTLALAVSLAGLVGLGRGEAGGGVIGGGLAALLGGSLGPVVAALILLLMALPSVVLAVLPLLAAQRERASDDLFS